MKFTSQGEEFDVRFAREGDEEDKNGFIRLWEICFDDTPEFVDFFFSSRYFPEYSVCIIHDGRLVAAMQSMPLQLMIRKVPVDAAIVAGVCTHPDFRSRGLMRKMFGHYLFEMRRRGIIAVTYHPVDFSIYSSLGHLPATRTRFYRYDAPQPVANIRFSMDVFDLRDLPEDMTRSAFGLYQKKAPDYSGIVARTYEDFALKMKDYAASDAKMVFAQDDSGYTGYCVYYVSKSEIHGEELIALTDDARLVLLDRLISLASRRKLTVKLPPAHGDGPLVPQNVIGVTDLQLFLKALSLERFVNGSVMSDFVIEVSDPIFKENCRPFDLHGEVSAKRPLAKVDIGHYIQFLCGYISADELLEIADAYSCLVVSIDKAMGKELCYIVDEY
ncbi:MAG: GNAT family N-acetyltransferase [Saccharofermentanales bacterium]